MGSRTPSKRISLGLLLGVAILNCLLGAVYASDDDAPIAAFGSAENYTGVLDLADQEYSRLLTSGVTPDKIAAELAAKMPGLIARMIDVPVDANDSPVLSAELKKGAEFIVREIVKRRPPVTPPPSPPAPPADDQGPEPSARIKPQDTNLRLMAIQEFKDYKKDPKLNASTRRGKLVGFVLGKAKILCDMSSPNTTITEGETAYLTLLADQVIAGRSTPVESDAEIGLSLDEQVKFRFQLGEQATELVRANPSNSPEFKKAIREFADAEFRKRANLASDAKLSDLQNRFIASQIRQVVARAVTLPKADEPPASNDGELRSLLLSLARQVNTGLLTAANSSTNAQAFMNPETRKATILNFVLGLIVKKKGLKDLEALSSADREEASRIAQEAVSDTAGTAGTPPVGGGQPIVGISVSPTPSILPYIILGGKKHHFSHRR